MLRGVIRGVGAWTIAVAGAVAAGGCAGDDDAPIANNRVVGAAPEPTVGQPPDGSSDGARPGAG